MTSVMGPDSEMKPREHNFSCINYVMHWGQLYLETCSNKLYDQLYSNIIGHKDLFALNAIPFR